jgi:hypothetical protein
MAVETLVEALRSQSLNATHVGEFAALALAYAMGVFALTYGWTADAGKARRATAMVLLFTAAAALLCLGGLGWSSDNDNDNEASGAKDSRGDNGNFVSSPHFGGWTADSAPHQRPDQRRSQTTVPVCLGCGRYLAGGAGGMCEACLWQQHR